MASLAVLVSLFVCATTLSSSGAAGVRVELTRIHSVHGVNASQSVRDALRGDMHRHNARRLVTASGGATVSAPTQEWSPLGAYLMTLAIDTGAACFQQPTPLYNPANSTTFSDHPCDSPLSICAATSLPGCVCPSYSYKYVSGWTSGVQGSETFTFGSNQTVVPNIAIGCSNASSDNFSPSSTLLVGSSASLNDTGVVSRPCVASPAQALTSIPADAFSMNDTDGTGGLVIDSGTTFTTLVDAEVESVLTTTLPTIDGSDDSTGLDLCFTLPSTTTSAPPAMPSMTLHFDGADLVLPVDSYMISYVISGSGGPPCGAWRCGTRPTTACRAFSATTSNRTCTSSSTLAKRLW
nr:unnamed protein product [Digitaria exilis]